MNYCKRLQSFLEDRPDLTFNTSGGCGIDGSLGESPCMDSSGIWFKFCPFCGREIVSERKNCHWIWYEKDTDLTYMNKVVNANFHLVQALKVVATPQEYKLIMQSIPRTTASELFK